MQGTNSRRSMDFQIRGHVEPAGVARYTAIAEAVPSGGGPTRELRETFTTRPQAVEGMRKLAVKLGAVIRSEGDEVIEVRTED